MGSDDASLEPKRKQKRDAEGDGRELLVAYLSDVGGYDRNYRDVEDEDESGSSGNKINIEAYSLYYLLYREQGWRNAESTHTSTNLTRVRFRHGVLCRSRFAPRVFFRVLQVSSPLKKQNIFEFQFDSYRNPA